MPLAKLRTSPRIRPLIKYLGSKRLLLPHLRTVIRALPGLRSVADLFAGTTRVGQLCKQEGLFVVSNDLAGYAEALGRTYIQADARRVDHEHLVRLLGELGALSPAPGYVTRTFCEESRYFQPANGARIDAIRAGIDRLAASAEERAILLTSLLEAADRVDSTTGLQMAYLKQWAPRSFAPLTLRLPALLPGPGLALRQDANQLARALDAVDLAYLDPPYNQHSYFANYHVWETIYRGDQPPAYGVARKRLDCRDQVSPYNRKGRIAAAFTDLVYALRARYLLVSYNDEAFLDPAFIARVLGERGYVAAVALDGRRYVGAQIGIYNPHGERVGRVSHLRNREYLFLVGERADVVRAAMAPLAAAAAAAAKIPPRSDEAAAPALVR